MEIRILTPKEQEICRRNLETQSLFFRFCTKKCTYCDFPLSGVEEHYHSLDAGGIICEVCHALEFALRGRKGLEAAQRQYKDEQKRKLKMLEQDGKKYFD